MMARCLALLERRRKERMKEAEYMNEATEESSEEASAHAEEGELHKRTQKSAPDATISTPEPAQSASTTADESASPAPPRGDGA